MSGYTVKTAPKPSGDGWQKMPSVTYGGAPSFWYRRNPETGVREWYAYDQIDREWQHRIDRDCPFCGRVETDGTWYAPCPSDDCPSNHGGV